MMTDFTFPLYALLLANFLALLAAILSIWRFQKMLRDSAKYWARPTGASAQMRCPAQAENNQLLMHEISVLRRSVAKICERERPRAEPLPHKLPLRHAVRMAKHGASIEELTRGCGLNVGEARLVRKLHGGVVAADTTASVQ